MDGVPGRPPQLHDLADVHYSRSVACQQYQRGIATVVLPNRAAGIDAGGSGAAGVWVGPLKHAGGAVARPRPSSAGARTHIIHDLLISCIGPGLYMISRYTEH